jgi:hypothetical protein
MAPMGKKSEGRILEIRNESGARVVGNGLISYRLMRKRIVIGLLAIVMIGVLVSFMSQPKKGTVEWHKMRFERHQTEYLEARDQNTWFDRLKRKYHKLTKTPPTPQTTAQFHAQLKIMEKTLDKMRHHRDALTRLGYFTEQRFTLVPGSCDWVMRGLGWHHAFDREDAVITAGTIGAPSRDYDEITVSACSKEMPDIEATIRALEAHFVQAGSQIRGRK